MGEGAATPVRWSSYVADVPSRRPLVASLGRGVVPGVQRTTYKAEMISVIEGHPEPQFGLTTMIGVPDASWMWTE